MHALIFTQTKIEIYRRVQAIVILIYVWTFEPHWLRYGIVTINMSGGLLHNLARNCVQLIKKIRKTWYEDVTVTAIFLQLILTVIFF